MKIRGNKICRENDLAKNKMFFLVSSYVNRSMLIVLNCLHNSIDMQSVIFLTVFVALVINSVPIEETAGRPKADGHRTKLAVDLQDNAEKMSEKHAKKVEIKKNNLKQEISQREDVQNIIDRLSIPSKFAL